MIALVRYQVAVLLRSQRWILPVILYAVLLSVGGAGPGSQSLAEGLDWSAAIAVPAVALLTRSMLTAEPPEARACVAAASSPARAQFATLLVALAGGAVLALVGVGYELLTVGPRGPQLVPLAAGLGTALVCVLVGSAVGTLFNPPVVRHPAAALLCTIAAVVAAWVSNISPANAALHGNGAAVQSAAWPAGVPLAAAVALVAVTWSVSCWLAGTRGG